MIAETIGIEHTPRQKTGSHAQTQKQNTTQRNIRTNSQNQKKYATIIINGYHHNRKRKQINNH